MCPKQGLEPCQKTFQAQRKDQVKFHSPAEEWVLPVASQELEEREFVVDSGGSMHMVSKRDLNSAELETMRTSRSPTTVMTANGEVRPIVKRRKMSNNWTYSWQLCFLKRHLGKLCEDRGFSYHWTSSQEPHLTKKARDLIAIYQTICHSLSLVYLRVSLQNYFIIIFITGFCIWRQQIHRKSSTRKKWKYEWGASGRPAAWIHRTENKYKNEGHEEVQSDLLHDLPDWHQDFRENLVDESSPTKPRGNPAHKDQDNTAGSSHELPMESQAKVEPGEGKHSVYTHFPKDPNCDICLKTKK